MFCLEAPENHLHHAVASVDNLIRLLRHLVIVEQLLISQVTSGALESRVLLTQWLHNFKALYNS